MWHQLIPLHAAVGVQVLHELQVESAPAALMDAGRNLA
jgi:hypothetical protein